jgi:hypothetical protein
MARHISLLLAAVILAAGMIGAAFIIRGAQPSEKVANAGNKPEQPPDQDEASSKKRTDASGNINQDTSPSKTGEKPQELSVTVPKVTAGDVFASRSSYTVGTILDVQGRVELIVDPSGNRYDTHLAHEHRRLLVLFIYPQPNSEGVIPPKTRYPADGSHRVTCTLPKSAEDLPVSVGMYLTVRAKFGGTDYTPESVGDGGFSGFTSPGAVNVRLIGVRFLSPPARP